MEDQQSRERERQWDVIKDKLKGAWHKDSTAGFDKVMCRPLVGSHGAWTDNGRTMPTIVSQAASPLTLLAKALIDTVYHGIDERYLEMQKLVATQILTV